MLTMAMAQFSSDDSVICYILSVSWMTLCFHLMVQIQIQAWNLFSATWQVALLNYAPGSKVCYCQLLCLTVEYAS